MSLETIKRKAAENAANNRSLLPMDRLRRENASLLAQEPAANSDALAAVDRAVENMAAECDPAMCAPGLGHDRTISAEAETDANEAEAKRVPLPQFTATQYVPIPKDADGNEMPLTSDPWIEELQHCIIQVGMWERKIAQKIVIGFPDGTKKRLGQILMDLGDHLMREEDAKREKPRIVLPGIGGKFDA